MLDSASEFGTNVLSAATQLGISAEAHRVPSPLNGERVRVRGDSARTLSHCESAIAFPPLTPALSPLRGEGETASRVRTTSPASPAERSPDAMRAFAGQPKSCRAQNECPSTASSKTGGLRCSTSRGGNYHAWRLHPGARESRVDLHRVPSCSEPQRSRSRGSAHPLYVADGTYMRKSVDHGEFATASSPPTWTFCEACGRGLRASSEGIDGTHGERKSRLAFPPLTLTLSPLRGEGTARQPAWMIHASFAEHRVRPFNAEKMDRIIVPLRDIIVTPRLRVSAVSEKI
jgi:hypothetical protein